VLERLGMRREGHLRQSTWAKGGWTDDLLYALLQEQWQAGPE
jgi:aminoglycoside 6'-N-acetyltransferase